MSLDFLSLVLQVQEVYVLGIFVLGIKDPGTLGSQSFGPGGLCHQGFSLVLQVPEVYVLGIKGPRIYVLEVFVLGIKRPGG